ncbi:uncharacterized protein LOC112552574 isoform X2 [Pogonomyrmex barbatus]|uniref:Uncharacterized protein LOC112552574 isoform X2 n=1 Tax=Pogonomyrmex barbatus TaxID=144034 RepID=A0A8N1S553_9HYME|nr:uncharacterized protein LOC112552574 isoform X2 [Pogonomyrmex barbatus]
MVFLCLRVAQYFIYFYFLSYIIFSVLSNSILKESSSRNKRVIPYIKDSYLVQARARFLSEKKEMLMTIQKEDEETEGKDQEAGMVMERMSRSRRRGRGRRMRRWLARKSPRKEQLPRKRYLLLCTFW